MPRKSTRDSAAESMARKRAGERDIVVPAVVDPARRIKCATDPYLFLSTYFPQRFTGRWTEDRRRMVDEIRHRATYGGDKAIAAPRGEGKTSIAEVEVGIDCVVNGLLAFPLICAATGPDARRILSNVKYEYEQNPLLLEDYPEVCAPIVALEGAPQRCNMQTVGGARTMLKWSDDYIRLPTVTLSWCPKCYWPEPRPNPAGKFPQGLRCQKCDHSYVPWQSVASGRIIATRGLDAAVRGLRYGSLRPDFCIIDDPETSESAKSDSQRVARESVIDKDLAGLGGPQRRVARLILTTISRADSLSARYTDPKQKPSFGGERLSLVKRWPDAKALWETYIDMRREDQEGGDPYGRRAHRHYLEHREEMDAGAVTANESRFSVGIMPDGSQEQVSTIQFVHDFAADAGWDAVFSELQNDPPSEDITEENRLTPFKVRGSHPNYVGRVTGQPRGFVPDGCRCLTAFVDVQHRSLYFEVVAWLAGDRRHIVDYGNFGDPTIRDRCGVEESIRANLRDLRHEWNERPFCGNDGQVALNKILVDSGDNATTVCEVVRQMGEPWQASKGEGHYHHPKARTREKRPSRTGDPWHESRVGHQYIVLFDAEWWGLRCHDSFTIQPSDRPAGCVTIFGNDPKDHATFGEQVCAQEWREEFTEGKGLKAGWVKIRKDNHYFDTHTGNLLAGAMCGVFRQQPQRVAHQHVESGRKPFVRQPGPGFLRRGQREK